MHNLYLCELLYEQPVSNYYNNLSLTFMSCMFDSLKNKLHKDTVTLVTFWWNFANKKYPLWIGMHDIIRTISDSADNGLTCKHRPDMKNYADMPCR